jgi:hypothetical protein
MRQKIQDPAILERMAVLGQTFNKMSLKTSRGYEMYFCSHIVNDEDLLNSKISFGIFSGGEPIDNMGMMDYSEFLSLSREWKLKQVGI